MKNIRPWLRPSDMVGEERDDTLFKGLYGMDLMFARRND